MIIRILEIFLACSTGGPNNSRRVVESSYLFYFVYIVTTPPFVFLRLLH